MSSEPHGIAFPADASGRRSSTAVGRGVIADALRPVDPAGARAAEQETAWRGRYLVHFRRQVEAGLGEPRDWLAMAAAGLDSIADRMAVVRDGTDAPVRTLLTDSPDRELGTVELRGTRPPAERLAIPYRGRELAGDALRAQLDGWVAAGVMEPSARDAVGVVIDNPGWLALPGRTVAVLGAGAEMGPLPALLRWGATAAAVDLPRPAVWERIARLARDGAGRLLVPVREPDTGRGLPHSAGVDLLAEVPAVAEWLLTRPERLVLGNYLYADGGVHTRISLAADVLAQRLQAARPDLALAFLATPTDVFAVPGEAVEHSVRAYARRSRTAKLLGRPLRWASRGRLLHRAYQPGADPGVCDALVPAQGPNYALAKRIQRWRAAVARDAGATVSFHVAPSSRTSSVVKNKALAAAFAGAHRFAVEIFEPTTANALMAALLVHDLSTTPVTHPHPWRDEADGAVHGGLWRTPYAPRSSLGLAAVLGYTTARM
ncbi:hypothetical protein [Pseudonocardia humida]|uniref:Uncharacterized protein n=1 Tax=Pseudonocardia humida TaxID=2800819 RepID=A0ABT0ZXY5_9PSEU|nr:hypothetical protein [Pseudonocardia humida]MCO1655607.1 hypothetical protein [Pseudonocardia humida]